MCSTIQLQDLHFINGLIQVTCLAITALDSDKLRRTIVRNPEIRLAHHGTFSDIQVACATERAT